MKGRRGRSRFGLDAARVKRWLIFAVPGSLVLVLLLLGLAYALARVPETSDFATSQSTIITDRYNQPFARFHAEVDRSDVPFEEMPKYLRDAVIVVEDRTFYRHGGVSVSSVIRAAFTNLVNRDVVQGGSTITQQYVKNAYVGRERTYWRKIKEVIVAMKLERSASKDEIFEQYLNTVYFGGGAYGVEAAARTHFGRPAKALSLSQAAFLAGAIHAPQRYAEDPERARERRNAVLDTMVDLAKISSKDAEAAKGETLSFVRRPPNFDTSVGIYFVEDVRKQLIDEFGENRVFRGGLRVRTTLDFKMQLAAEEAVRKTLDRPDDPEAALVAVEPQTGAVRALVGGRDFARQKMNLATQGRGRQPGSAFKPFILAAALDEGTSIKSTFRAPFSIVLKTGFEPWDVSNYDERDYGTLDLLDATAFSVNTVYAQLILEVGPRAAAQAAQRAGITSPMSAVPSLALGTKEVKPIELAGAYATFANRGLHLAPHLIERVVAPDGEVLFEAEIEPVRAFEERVANTVNYALRNVIERGTGRSAAFGRPAAGKTGTTEFHVDAWFAGYTPELAAAVWMGYPQGGKRMENVRGAAVVGGSFPAQIWRAFMSAVHNGKPITDFGKPDLGGAVASSTPSVAPSPSPSATTIPPSSFSPAPSLPPKKTKPPSPGPSPTSSQSSSPTPTPTPAPAPGPT